MLVLVFSFIEIPIMNEIGSSVTTENTTVDSNNFDVSNGETSSDLEQKAENNVDEEPKLKKQKTTPTAAQLRKKVREEESKARKLKKLQEEERKRDEKRLKKQEELKRRQQKKEQEELERKRKREAIEEEKQAKKELKEKERLEKIRKREVEQQSKEEKKRIEELEKQQKKEEAEKKKQEEEQRKQKRSITNFFKVKPNDDPNSSMVQSSPMKELTVINSSNCQQESQFDLFFLPFYINADVTLADNSHKIKSPKWEMFIQDSASIPYEVSIQAPPIDKKTYPTANSVVQLMNSGMSNDAELSFKSFPIRYLRFYENRKPPFYGTFTKPMVDGILTNPFMKIESIDYDVDSDYSDGEDDEGEDVDMDDDEDDEDEDDEDDEDIDTFVESDDNSTNSTNKRSIMGPLVPLVRNIKDEHPQQDEFSDYFQNLEWKTVREDVKFPLDPFANYWGGSKPVKITPTAAPVVTETDVKPTISPSVSAGPMLVKKRVISDEKALNALCEFIKANGTLSINTLAELASKNVIELSKISRSLVKNSIREVARFDKKSSKWEIV